MASEELNRAVLSSLRNPIAVLDHDGTIIAVNEAWSQFASNHGVASTEGIGVGVNYLEVCRQASGELSGEVNQVVSDIQSVLAGIQSVLEGSSKSYRQEYSCPASSEVEWYALTVTPLRWESGGAVVSHLNITRQKNVEEALRKSEELAQSQFTQLRSIYASAPAGLCFLDKEMRYVAINETLARMNGRPVEEHLGRTAHEMVPHIYEKLGPVYRHVIETGEPSTGVEIRGPIRTQPGKEGVWLVSHYPAKDEENSVVGINIVVQDITEQKRAEEELRRAYVEIGELPLDLQIKLLRVLQEGEFERLGSSRTIQVNVRVIAATNRNLEEAVRNGTFRTDLYYRLNVFPLMVPPLRERKEDISPLVSVFVGTYAQKMGKRIEKIPPETMDALKSYQWPGNIRELRNVIERALIVTQGAELRLANLLKDPLAVEPPEIKPQPQPGAAPQMTKSLQEFEREHILQALEATRWKIEGKGGAAEVLALHPATLRYRIRKLGIQRPNHSNRNRDT